MTTPKQMKINRDRKVTSTLCSAVVGIMDMSRRQDEDNWTSVLTKRETPLGNLFWFIVNLHHEVYMAHMALPSPESFK